MADGLRKGLTSYGDAGFSLFLRKAFIKAMGYSDDALNRPIVGITNTYSDYNPCHGNVPQIDRGGEARRDAGGRRCRWCSRPSRSHESFSHPTSMYLRNLMAMDTEEMIRAQPMDAVVRDRRLRQDPAGADHGRGRAPICRPSCSRWGRWWSAITRARCWAPAPIAAGCGRNIAPAKSTRSRSRPSTAGSRLRSAPAW